MKLTNEYQYIGRTNMISCASGWDYRILLYAKTKGDMDTGKHTVSVKQVMACNIMSSFYNFPTNGYVKVGGNTVESWTFQPVPNKAWNETWITVGGYSYGRWVDITEGSVEVDTGYGADTDITIESFWEMAYAGTEAWLPPYKETGTASIVVTLPKIIGASYITSVDDITIGKPCNVKWTPLASTFCYKLRFSIGDWSYTTEVIAPGSTSAYTYTGYTIPMEVANRITNGPSGGMKVELFSYLDSSCTTQIGSADEEIVTATVPDNSDTKPSVSMALDIVSTLDSTFAGLYIQNLTKVSAEISGSGKYGASVEETRLVIGGAQYSNPCVSGFLTATGNVTVTGEAVDSRGYVGKAEKIITVIPYSRPAIVPVDGETGIVCARCDASGNFTDSGTYLRIKAKRFYSPIISDGVQKNRCLIQYRVNGGSWVTILSRTSASDEVDTGPISGKVSSVSSSYTIDIGVADDVGESSYTTIIVPTDEVTFHLRHGGNGAAFGEYAVDENVLSVADDWAVSVKGKRVAFGAEPTEDGFTCAMDATFTKSVSMPGLVDMIYPVGSIYMSVNEVSPSVFIGGVWERIQDRFLLAAGSDYTAGDIGGEATHSLTTEEMPSHNHKGILYTNSGGVESYITLNAGTSGYRLNWTANGGNGSNELYTAPEGGGAAHNNMPPYLAVYIWKRTA